jgi:hypothetical protein
MENIVAQRRARTAELTIEFLTMREHELQDQNALLVNRIGDLERERDIYREMTQLTLAQLARTTAQLELARREIFAFRSRQREAGESRHRAA